MKNLVKIIDSNKSITSAAIQNERQSQSNLNDRLDGLYFLGISANDYDNLTTKSDSCVYVVYRNGFIEFYRGSKRIVIGTGVVLNHAIVLRMEDEEDGQ